MPASLRERYAAPSPFLLQPEFIARIGSEVRPQFVGVPRRQYLALVSRMVKNGMVDLRPEVRAVNGVFGVWKELDSSIRLIVDLRRGNAAFLPSPHVSLPNAADFCNLTLADGQVLVMGKMDLSNYYYQIRIPLWMSDYFGLPAVDVQSLDLSEADRAALQLPTNGRLFPACRTLPMGFRMPCIWHRQCMSTYWRSTASPLPTPGSDRRLWRRTLTTHST